MEIAQREQQLLTPYNKVYPIVVSSIEYRKKPTAYGRLHKDLDSTETAYATLYELLEAVAVQGRTFRNGIHAKPSEQYHNYPLTKEEEDFLQKKKSELSEAEYFEAVRLMKQQKIINELEEANVKDTPEFIESDLAVLDFDDVLGKADPIEIMKESGAIALYYTFSHETKSPINTTMFRYRLLFDLSESVKGKKAIEEVQQAIKDSVLNKYPYLHDQTIKNDKTKKTKSHGIDNLTKMFLGSTKGYEINEGYKTFDVSEVLERVQKENEFLALTDKIERLNAPKTRTTETEILDIANFLGDMNDDNIDHDTWKTVAIGLWNTAQVEGIDDNVVLEALKTLDGNRQNDKYYYDFKKPLSSRKDKATIGTLIMLATDRGYKRQYSQQPAKDDEQVPQIATRTHKIDKYIDKADVYELLDNNDKRILIQSDTNTGKTRSIIEASKEYLKNNKNAFVYLAFPTIPLSRQAVEDYNLNQAVLGNVNVNKIIQQAIYNDSRFLVGTYDKTKIVYDLLQDYKMIVIADEAHKEVFDYSYRHEAIQNLFDVDAPKFIGLTGTPSEIDKNSYDSLEIFKLKEPKVLADKLQFIDYSNANGYENLTAQIIELEVKNNKNKVLAFVNNKNVIKKLARALRSEGLKVATISADVEPMKSKNYMHIMKKQKFADDIDVILSTIVLADGININNTKDYVCMIAPSHYKNAPMFNVDTIRQATNRFRNQYNKIIVPFYVNKDLLEANYYNEPRTSDRPYNLERQYNFLLESAEISKALLQVEFNNDIEHFTPSIAEKVSGLFRPKEADEFNFKLAYENQRLARQGLNHDETLLKELEELESKIWDIDTRTIRQQASEDKQNHYSLYPHAFRKELKKTLNVLEVEETLAHDYLIEMKATHEIAKVLEELNKLEIETEREKRDNVKIILHELLYAKVQNDYLQRGRVNESVEEWQLLRDKMASMHYNALTKLVRFMDYEEVIQELNYIQKNAQVYELVSSFKAITELKQFEKTGAETITEQIFIELFNNVAGREYHSKKEVDEHIEELAKGFKVKKRYTIAKRKKLFDKSFKLYFALESNKSVRVNGKVRKRSIYKILDFDTLAKQRDIAVEEVTALYEKYRYKYR